MHLELTAFDEGGGESKLLRFGEKVFGAFPGWGGESFQGGPWSGGNWAFVTRDVPWKPSDVLTSLAT